MRGRFLAKTFTMLMLGVAAVLVTAGLAGAAGPVQNFNVTAMLGNEAETASAVNPAKPSNVVALPTLPDGPAGLAVGVSFNGGRSWPRRVIGAAGDPLGETCGYQTRGTPEHEHRERLRKKPAPHGAPF